MWRNMVDIVVSLQAFGEFPGFYRRAKAEHLVVGSGERVQYMVLCSVECIDGESIVYHRFAVWNVW